MKLGRLDKWVTLSRRPVTVNDSDGYWEDLSPSGGWALIQPLSPTDNGNAITHLVTMRFHPQVTMDTRVVYGDRELIVKGFQNVDEYDRDMVLICEEAVS